jgi:hypothetical protein
MAQRGGFEGFRRAQTAVPPPQTQQASGLGPGENSNALQG